jgi:aryl-alcohol dehydrogenase-like predicted oxidoreductase
MERVDKRKQILPGMFPPERALRFVLSHPAVSTTVVGMRNV